MTRRAAALLMLLAAVLLPAVPGGARAGGGSADAAPRFLDALEDVPLPPGLAEVADAGMVFDTPQGRIVEAYAEGPADRDSVARFYRDTLPQLGWRRAGVRHYVREGETLDLSFERPAGGPLTVRFSLAPTGGGSDR